MAPSQRLVDPSRQFAVPTSYSWQKSYQAALLETDWTKMQERVQRAESEIHQRRLVLSQDQKKKKKKKKKKDEVLRMGCGCLAGAAECEVRDDLAPPYASHR